MGEKYTPPEVEQEAQVDLETSQEKAKLENNLTELHQNLQKVENSPQSVKERVLNIWKNSTVLPFFLGAGLGEIIRTGYDGGDLQTALAKLGLWAVSGVAIEAIVKIIKILSEESGSKNRATEI